MDYLCKRKIKKGKKKRGCLFRQPLVVIPLGLEPRAPTLKVLCSTN